ncbi:MAG TPA: hypothetical protein VJ919_06500, partial [Tangfeifania sp.]|nr:hypothetical protein [Tangfeifania sp.]
MKEEPKIEVGIMAQPEIKFLLSGVFNSKKEEMPADRIYTAVIEKNHVVIQSNGDELYKDDSFFLVPKNSDTSFELKEVTIGVDFHWEQKEN